MCVDTDLEGEDEEEDTEHYEQLSVDQALESEIRSAADNGYDSLRWLELEGLGIDADTFLSLDIPSKFQVQPFDLSSSSPMNECVKSTKIVKRLCFATGIFGRTCWL